VDSYSGLFDNGHRKDTGLGDYLKDNQVDDVYIAGLATDYCVKFTALDTAHLGFRTHVIKEACRGVNLQPTDVDQAYEQMQRAGIHVK
jgi:nicotinamidase/pyrazinamidase